MFRVTQDGVILAMIIVLVGVISHHPVNSGKRSFGESCSFGGHITSFFSPEREERTCDRNMGLICTGKCSCPPGRVWDFSASDYGFTDREFRAVRGCAGAVGSPCIGSSRNQQQCVSNAHCQFAFCRCKSNFRPSGGHCVSTNLDGEGGDDEGQSRPGPGISNGITFPELQGIFSGFHSYNSNPSANNPSANNPSANNPSDNNQNFFNSKDIPFENDFNDRLPTNSENSYNNDRFPISPDSYHDHHNSRDGSKGSGSIRFE